MVKQEIKILVRRFVSTLRDVNIRVRKIVLYGSAARNKGRIDGDIDIAVISDDFGKDRMKEGMLLFRIASKIDPRIEPIPISSRAYKQDGWIPLLHEIKSTGIEITL